MISGSASTTSRDSSRFLAGLRRHSYLGAGTAGLILACGHTTPVAPSGAFGASSPQEFAVAARGTAPGRPELVRFSWRSDDGSLQLAGSGAARIAPPDSLRADIAASLGIGRATVILTGDSAVARPPNIVDQILPDRFAMWAVLGIAKAPPGDVRVELLVDGGRSLWRLTDAMGRATVYELMGGALASVTREEAGRQTSQLKLTRGTDGTVGRASLTDVLRNLRLEITINGREASDAFPPETWRLGP